MIEEEIEILSIPVLNFALRAFPGRDWLASFVPAIDADIAERTRGGARLPREICSILGRTRDQGYPYRDAACYGQDLDKIWQIRRGAANAGISRYPDRTRRRFS